MAELLTEQPSDPASVTWVEELGATGAGHDRAVARLHELLLRAAIVETARRSGTHGLTGRELDDLAHQAADDATVSVLRRLPDFRGESRFTTWAYAFAVREVSTKVGRHVWRRDGVSFSDDAWDRLPERIGQGPEDHSDARELLESLRAAVLEVLTEHQRHVFTALVLHGAPVEAVAAELGTNRNAIYKTMFDARRKLRSFLVERGHLPQ